MDSPWTQALTCGLANWTPGFGVPDAGSLFLLALYLTAAPLCWLVYARAPFPDATHRPERLFWGLTAAIVTLLAINTQLNLQTVITDTGRCLARLDGWYANRRPVQRQITLGLIGFALLAGLALTLLLRRALARNVLALAGLALLMAFVILRVVSLHQIDSLLRGRIFGIGLNRLIEGTALILLISGTFAPLRRQRHAR